VCELVPSFVIPSVDVFPSAKIKYFEECVVREYIDARIEAYSLESW